jgi:hypothetical protein
MTWPVSSLKAVWSLRMLNAGEWVRLEQALSEVTVHHEHFPECLRYRKQFSAMVWDQLSLNDRVGLAAEHLFHCGVMGGAAKIIHQAYIKLCTGR